MFGDRPEVRLPSVPRCGYSVGRVFTHSRIFGRDTNRNAGHNLERRLVQTLVPFLPRIWGP